MSCLRRSWWTFASALAVGAPLAVLGPAATTTPAAAAECKHSAKPAYELRKKRARRATACLINKQRRARGLRRLKQRPAPRKAAKRHTRVMVQKRCFSHVCPGEKGLVGRLTATGYLPCGCSWGLAENIAYAHGRASSPRQIVKRWMSSSKHRASLLDRSFEHLGIGIRRGAPSGGRRAATYTTDFGYRN